MEPPELPVTRTTRPGRREGGLEDTGPVHVAAGAPPVGEQTTQEDLPAAEPPRQPLIRRHPVAVQPDLDSTWDDTPDSDLDKTGELEWRQPPRPEPPAHDPWGSPPMDPNQEATNIIRAIPEGLLDDD